MLGVSLPSFIKIGALESTLKSGELKSRKNHQKNHQIQILSPNSGFCTSHKIRLESNFRTRFFATFSLMPGELNINEKIRRGSGKCAKLTSKDHLLLPGIYSTRSQLCRLSGGGAATAAAVAR